MKIKGNMWEYTPATVGKPSNDNFWEMHLQQHEQPVRFAVPGIGEIGGCLQFIVLSIHFCINQYSEVSQREHSAK